MGVEHNLFVKGDTISESFECKICLLVLEDPIKLAGCDHYFCQSCIQRWFQAQKTCPTCRTHQNNTNLSNLAAQAHVLRNLLGEEERYCVNRPEGCYWVGPGSLLPAHESDECLAAQVRGLKAENESLGEQIQHMHPHHQCSAQSPHQQLSDLHMIAIVSGAGHQAVNGHYHRIQDNDGACAFQSCRSAGNLDIFTLYRCKMRSGAHRRWYISIVPPGKKPGTDADTDFYFTYAAPGVSRNGSGPSTPEMLPTLPWPTCGSNPNVVLPNPTVTISWRTVECFNNYP